MRLNPPTAPAADFPPARSGFTIVEMLAVIFIIAILISTLSLAVSKVKSLARQADCKSNLRQIGAAVLIYRSDHGGRNPDWLSCLYPSYVDDLHLFICRSDANRGTGRTRPPGITTDDTASQQKFPETTDNSSNPGRTAIGTPWSNTGGGCSAAANTTVQACSYLYEFSAAYCDPNWLTTKPNLTWVEFKEHQLLYGDAASSNQPYSSSRMPIIRCYHHAREGRINGHPEKDPAGSGVDKTVTLFYPITINVAYAGNVYVGPLWWEGALQPGER